MDEQTTEAGQDPKTTGNEESAKLQTELEKVRKEAAARRVEAKELKAKLAELQPIAEQFQALQDEKKTEAEKMADRLAELEKQLNAKSAEIEASNKRNQLLGLGVNADLLPMLNLDSLAWDDADKLTQQIAAFTSSKPNAQTSSPQSGGDKSPAITQDWLKTASRADIAANMDAIKKALQPKGGTRL